MKRFLTLGIRAVVCVALAAEAKEHVILVPGHCLEADNFSKPCPASKYGGYDCNKVHVSVRPLPECAQYDHQRVLRVLR